jgi:hypothetical protein
LHTQWDFEQFWLCDIGNLPSQSTAWFRGETARPSNESHTPLYGPRVVWHHVVGHKIVRALGGKHNPEVFHLTIDGKSFDLDHFAT